MSTAGGPKPESLVLPMKDDFWTHYFVQTRREIDKEKDQRQLILNFIFLSIGGVIITVAVQISKIQLTARESLILFGATTLGILGLFGVRAHMLQNIANRWFTLLYFAGANWLTDVTDRPYVFELIVCNGLHDCWGRRIAIKKRLDAGARVDLVSHRHLKPLWRFFAPPDYRAPDAIISGLLMAAVSVVLAVWWLSSPPPDVDYKLFWVIVGAFLGVFLFFAIRTHYWPLSDPWRFHDGDIVPVDGYVICRIGKVGQDVLRGGAMPSCGAHREQCEWKYRWYESVAKPPPSHHPLRRLLSQVGSFLIGRS